MKEQLSSRDWYLLSNYLDGQLTEKERLQVDARLKVSPELQEAYRALIHYRKLLRSLPVRRVRRNFTLTRAMTEQRKPFAFFPVLRWASMASTLVAAVLVIGSLMLANLGAAKTAQVEDAYRAEVAAVSEPTSIIIQWFGGAEVQGKGGGGDAAAMGEKQGGGVAAGIPELTTGEVGPEVGTEPVGEVTPTPVPEGEYRMMQPPVVVTAEETEQPTEMYSLASPEGQTPEAMPEESPAEAGGYILGLPSAEVQGKVIATNRAAAPQKSAPYRNLPYWVAAALALVGIGTGLASYLLRKRM